MIEVFKYNFGDYNQKLIIDGKKIIDVECDCKWMKNNPRAWREGKTLCHHIKSAIERREIDIHNERRGGMERIQNKG